MLDILTAEDVRRQDADCEARGITTESLMGNAGFAVAAAARRMLGGTYGRRVVVVCGKGNNAGDGLVAGRWLASWGAHATAVLLLGDQDLKGAARANLERFGGRRRGPETLAREAGRADLVIDAIFGVGLSRAPEGAAKAAIELLASGDRRVLSVDVPSGVDADTGRVPGGAAVRAALTVTLGGLKPGLLFPPGMLAAGRIEVADIGVPEDLQGGAGIALGEEDVAELLPRRAPGTNKRRVGTVLVVAGSRAMPGAAALTAAACVHAGAGLTTLAAPESVVPTVIARVPEITTIPLPETSEGTLDEKGLEQIRPRLGEFHAVAIGPGLSTHPATAEAVRALVAEAEIPVVLDADGINAFAGATELLRARGAPTVLTPHAGEMSRLVGRPSAEIESDRLAAARGAARDLGCIVLLKGPGTVIAGPDGALYVNTTGSAALAQGGTGDVLTGMLGALLAQDRELRSAGGEALVVAVGAWLHGRAGDRAAGRVAPHPANASLLVELLPEVIHEVAG